MNINKQLGYLYARHGGRGDMDMHGGDFDVSEVPTYIA